MRIPRWAALVAALLVAHGVAMPPWSLRPGPAGATSAAVLPTEAPAAAAGACCGTMACCAAGRACATGACAGDSIARFAAAATQPAPASSTLRTAACDAPESTIVSGGIGPMIGPGASPFRCALATTGAFAVGDLAPSDAAIELGDPPPRT
jgi:hypothetical protein